MVINSQQCMDVFPDNKPYRFFTPLKSQLTLKGVWKVALIDIKIPQNNHLFVEKDLYIFSIMCGESVVDGVSQPLLRRVCPSSSEFDYYSFKHPCYVSVIKHELFDIEFYIKDEHRDKASFLNQPLTLTLHFKAYLFLY